MVIFYGPFFLVSFQIDLGWKKKQPIFKKKREMGKKA